MMQTALVELSSQHQLLERLETLTRFSSHIIFVHGDSGSAKTTLAQSLLDRCQFANQAWVCVESELTDSQIREQLLKQWLRDPLFNADDPLWESLFRNQESSGGVQLLVIDQAELLSPQIYSELFELVEKYSQNYKDALNVVLFSSSRYRQLAREYSWQVSDVLELDIEPLDEYESNLLAKQLFVRAQYQSSVANKQALAKLIEAAQGNPRAICQVVEQTISGAGIMSQEQNKARKPYLIWMIIAVIIAAVAGLAVQLLHSNDQPEAKQSVPLKPNSEIPVVIPAKKTADNSAAAAQSDSGTTPTESSQKDNTADLPAPVTDKTITKKDSPEVGQKRVVVDDQVVDELLKAQQSSTEQQSADKDSAKAEQSATSPQAQDESASAASSSASDSQPSAPSAQNSADTTPATPATSSNSAANASSTNTTTTVATPAQGQDTESVLNAKAPKHYTLQLGAFSSMRAATDFVKRGKYSPAWVYPFQGSSQILYKVITGDFASRQQALGEQRKLKAQGQVSLLKSFRQVQFELKQS
ncbi:SPOR domain-containing protein [Celerinatantimonas sp. MCCC 1A17872]|uniref:SPOR domain-containing protein n=1 Tax=Celerinatantimonas sp. MCCC 1A17872 TaxID=3177514 RepID=UPI0038C6743A